MKAIWAYLAGLLEVGGYIGFDDGQPSIQVSVPREAGLLLQRRLGMGSVFNRSGRLWAWSVSGPEVPAILVGVSEFVSKPRQQEIQQAIMQAYGDAGSES